MKVIIIGQPDDSLCNQKAAQGLATARTMANISQRRDGVSGRPGHGCDFSLAFPANIFINAVAGKKHPTNSWKKLRAQNDAGAYLIVGHIIAMIGT